MIQIRKIVIFEVFFGMVNYGIVHCVKFFETDFQINA